MKVLSSSGDWHKVQFDGDEIGWSHKNYIKKTSSSGSSMNVKKKLTVKAYAYTGGGYTATGTKAKYGTLAVDPKVIPYGTKVYIKELDKVFTAEDCGGGTGGGYTATGTKAKYGTLAVDPKVIPYGTKVYIKELDKVFTAEDCGGGIKGNKVDIYMNSESACRNWGVRTITLQILK